MSMITTAVLTNGSEHWDGPGAWWPVFPILWFTIVVGIVAMLVIGARRRARLAGPRAGEAKLAELFATGEISEDEYRSRLSVFKEQR